MSVIVYSDFSSPESYVASRRADALASAGVPVDWRAVEQRPARPVNGVRLSAEGQQASRDRFAELDQLLLPGERLPWTMPGLVPKTEAAVSAYAEAYGSSVDGEVRRLLFELYWRDGAWTSAARPRCAPRWPARCCAAQTDRCDIADRADIAALLRDFYGRAFRDELLGPVFVSARRTPLPSRPR